MRTVIEAVVRREGELHTVKITVEAPAALAPSLAGWRRRKISELFWPESWVEHVREYDEPDGSESEVS